MPSTLVPTVLNPPDTAPLLSASSGPVAPPVWIYRYVEPENGWRLSIATCAAPGSGQLSLGGFRIATQERTESPGFDTDREAMGLAIGMEGKVQWSRVLGIAGPLARRDMGRFVGGKCVLHPTPGSRIGQPGDRAMLDFALACFADAESRGGFRITTGQDLGHGLMSDGVTTSLQYLSERFTGCVVSDTSQPTGIGNFHLLRGMLRGEDIEVQAATIGLIGCGNVGSRVLERLRECGTNVLVMDASPRRRDELAALGITTFAPDRKREMLAAPIDAVVVNASGGSLDSAALEILARNARCTVVCGSENLAMPDGAAGAELLRKARKAYAPTELGGMMGYLTAVEEFLAWIEGVPFDIGSMVDAAELLTGPGEAAMRLLRQRDFAITYEAALRAVCSAT